MTRTPSDRSRRVARRLLLVAVAVAAVTASAAPAGASSRISAAGAATPARIAAAHHAQSQLTVTFRPDRSYEIRTILCRQVTLIGSIRGTGGAEYLHLDRIVATTAALRL